MTLEKIPGRFLEVCDLQPLSKFLQNPKMNTTILISVIRRFQGALMAYSAEKKNLKFCVRSDLNWFI